MANKGTSQSNYAQAFKNSSPKTRFIIDCTEFYCEAPTSLEPKGNMYSDFKGRETYKALVGITFHWACFFCFSPLLWEFIWLREWKEVVFSTQTCLMIVMK